MVTNQNKIFYYNGYFDELAVIFIPTNTAINLGK